VVETRVIPADEAGIAEAASLIRLGQPVAVPTETVYGLAADAGQDRAVASIYAAKRRPAFNPLIVHVGDLAMAAEIASLPPLALRLAESFWPGPLTMVLKRRDDARIARLATAGLPTVALRIPAHPVIRALIGATGKPLAAPSANASGSISATLAEHVARSLAGRVPLVLDGGATEVGIESTIIAVEADRLRLLRPGGLTIEALEAVAGAPVEVSAGGAIEAPGQLSSHYAPGKPLRLGAVRAEPGEFLIGFGEIAGAASLSPNGDLVEAAARLFDLLHRADASDASGIAIAPVPDTGLGLAINDRLKRAAAPR